MALWFIAEDGRKAYKPPYTKAEQMAMYKRMADGPKVIVKHSGHPPVQQYQQELQLPQQPEEQPRS